MPVSFNSRLSHLELKGKSYSSSTHNLRGNFKAGRLGKDTELLLPLWAADASIHLPYWIQHRSILIINHTSTNSTKSWIIFLKDGFFLPSYLTAQ